MNPAAPLPRSLVLVGAGKMGGAMLDGWLERGLPPAAVTVIDPQPADSLKRHPSLSINPPGRPSPPEILVLAIKPQALEAAAPALLAWIAPSTTIVSILAGKTVADLARSLPGTEAIVRAMPNLPASIGRGATGAFASSGTSTAQRATVDTLLRAVGTVEWVEDERLIDAVTAVSGSGPAYLFHLVESLAAAAREAGLEPAMADRLARATVVGAAELLGRSELDPAELRRNVTSPGGTTAAALDVLAGAGGLGPLMRDTVAAAKRRATELSG